jgi:hypothetical protein
MPKVVIEIRILNLPIDALVRRFCFTDECGAHAIITGRRPSSNCVSISKTRTRNEAQTAFEMKWAEERIE